MVIFKETLDDVTMLGLMKMVYHFPVEYYFWNDHKLNYDYEYFEDLPDSFKINTIALKYSDKVIYVFLEKA